MTLDELIQTLRMAAVSENTITAMTNAYNLGFEAGQEKQAQPEQIAGFDVVIDETMPSNTFKLVQPEQKPVKFLAFGSRFKISDGKIQGIPDELAGRWVALVPAEDDCHLNLTTPPQRKPLTDEMVLAGGKALAKRHADSCGLDFDDVWKFYADEHKDDANAVLEAAYGIKGAA